MSDNRTIHVVYDDAIDRPSLVRLLNSGGLATVVYNTPQSLLDAAPNLLDGCIFLDMERLPVDGLALQSSLNALGVRLPVIVTTRQGDVATAVQAIKAGAVDFIQKPFDPERLLARIEIALTVPRNGSTYREAAEAARRIAVLSARERQVLDAIVAGHPNKVIAHNLAISMRTVEVHRANMLERLGIRSIAEAIRLAALATLMPAEGGSNEAAA